MQPPERPGPFDCCGGGCTPCVYDLYAEELRQYQEWLKEQGEQEETPGVAQPGEKNEPEE